jgi:hypothetical protein
LAHDSEHKIQDYTWISDRIIETRIKVLNRNFTIVSVHAPVEGKEQGTEEFYGELQQSMDKIPKKEKLFLQEDIWRTSNELQWSSIQKFLCLQ